eukprot:6481675-Prymnesium_polylepis.1
MQIEQPIGTSPASAELRRCGVAVGKCHELVAADGGRNPPTLIVLAVSLVPVVEEEHNVSSRTCAEGSRVVQPPRAARWWPGPRRICPLSCVR